MWSQIDEPKPNPNKSMDFVQNQWAAILPIRDNGTIKYEPDDWKSGGRKMQADRWIQFKSQQKWRE